MRIVLDTNVLLVALPRLSRYHLIFQKLVDKKYDLFISNEILSEYEEQIGMRLGVDRTELQIIELLNLPNVHKVEPFYFWNLIEADQDDNKFVDCAVSCGADYLVSNDKHYQVLLNTDFPKVSLLRAEEFLDMIMNL